MLRSIKNGEIMESKRFIDAALAIAEQMGFRVYFMSRKKIWAIDFKNKKYLSEEKLGTLFFAGIATPGLTIKEINKIMTAAKAQPCTHFGMRAIIAKIHARGLS